MTRAVLLACGGIVAATASAMTGTRGDLQRAAALPGAHAAATDPSGARQDPTAGHDSDPAGPPLAGDAALSGEIDLDRATLADGRYSVRLSDRSRAILTLDPALQAAAEKVLERAQAPVGAIVVMHVDGRILALAGRRLESPDQPASDLALSVWAPAASVFKIVTAAALLDAGLTPQSRVCSHGGLRSVDAAHLEDSSRDRDCDTLSGAMARSQNALFGKLAHRHLDRDSLGRAARAFGMDSAPRFALDAEANRFRLPAQPLEFARVAAGFWSSELSALGGAVLANTVASGGLSVTPRVVEAIEDQGGGLRQVEPAPAPRALPEKVARDLAAMLVQTTASGTAYRGFHDNAGRPFLPRVAVAGKTGSLTRTTPSYLAYSWFVGFAPADAPEITISVLLGNPPKWHLKAHTAARLVLQKAL